MTRGYKCEYCDFTELYCDSCMKVIGYWNGDDIPDEIYIDCLECHKKENKK